MKTQTATIIILLGMGLLLSACGDGLGSFTFTEDSQEVVVEGSALGGVLPESALSLITLNVNLDQELEKRDAKQAKAVYLTGLDLQVTDTEQPEGDTDNFNFLNSITVYVNAEGQERQQLATREPVPEGQQSVALEVDDSIDLKPYIEAGMQLETDASGSQPADDTSVKVVATIRVRVL